MQLQEARKYLRLIKPGDEIQVRTNNGEVLQLERQVSLSEVLNISRAENDYAARMIEQALEAQPTFTKGEIDSSLFLAAAEAGISDRLIMNLAGIFAWDIDFVLDIARGETSSRWSTRNSGRTASASQKVIFSRRNSSIAVSASGPCATRMLPDGSTTTRPTDAAFAKPSSAHRCRSRAISSNFNPKRRHPKLNTIRAHKGVDYAAPTRTPIKAAGDGKIVHRGVKGGYGKTVIIQHGGNISTLYAHMSRYSKARIGSRVRQGDIIGYVGATGLATGPHLHYEYRRNGVHLNPRTVKLPDADPIDAAYLADFQQAAAPLLRRLDNERTLVAADTP